MRAVIQNLVFPTVAKHKECRDLFFRGSGIYSADSAEFFLSAGNDADFCTYLNGCSYGKWRRYTKAKKLRLILEIEGACDITFTGYTLDLLVTSRREFKTIYKRKTEREVLEFEYPESDEPVLICGFDLSAVEDCKLISGQYTVECDEDELNDVELCIASTTFKNEQLIKNNVDLMRRELIQPDDEIGKHIYFHVVDNGCSLDAKDFDAYHVFLHPNGNSGGAGGFARGMIESINQDPQATHVLLMDDDVLVLPESIRRTYCLLRLMKPDYKNHFISGAMLYYEEPFRQHEDIGTLRGGCEFLSLKPKLDHRTINDNLINEKHFLKYPNQYAGWWYCCIPTSVIKEHGLPLPVFIRCDDMEYSLRCHAEIITMNGICIWHMGFVRKYNSAFDKYQQCRNLLIAKACSDDIMLNADIDRFVRHTFRIQMLKHNYDSAELVLRAYEHYLEGPSFLKDNRGEQIVKENSKLNDRMRPLEEVCSFPIPNVFECYDDPPRKWHQKLIYGITYNGQRFCPTFLLKEEPVIVAFDHTYQPSKMTLRKNIVMVNPYAETGRLLTIDKQRFRSLLKRFNKADRYYKTNRESLIRDYRNAKSELTSEVFWRQYLNLSAKDADTTHQQETN